ncbi:MAG TPA: hypothetical protein VFJ90_16380 [Candidatus Didemnitutus sp.]|nr:hypothetical protein [Candidatus Didemnitutus sp.]
MAYQDGTYVSFHLGGTVPPFASDDEWRDSLKSWTGLTDDAFAFVPTKEKELAAADPKKKKALRMEVQRNLRNSRHLLLLLDDTTHLDEDWVPFEVEFAVDQCQIPIIAAYPGYSYIIAPEQLRNTWPDVVTQRIDDASAKIIHVPFKQEPLAKALSTYHVRMPPRSALSFFLKESYQKWGLMQ